MRIKYYIIYNAHTYIFIYPSRHALILRTFLTLYSHLYVGPLPAVFFSVLSE